MKNSDVINMNLTGYGPWIDKASRFYLITEHLYNNFIFNHCPLDDKEYFFCKTLSNYLHEVYYLMAITIELLLKGIIIEKSIEVNNLNKTHNLVDLANLGKNYISFTKQQEEILSILTTYSYEIGRYPIFKDPDSSKNEKLFILLNKTPNSTTTTHKKISFSDFKNICVNILSTLKNSEVYLGKT